MHKTIKSLLESTETREADVKVVLITPAIAHTLLATNTSNRRMKRDIVAKYSKAIRDGRWMLTGETISVSQDGRLLNGQHRLQSVINTGKSIWTHLAYNIDPEAFDFIDNVSKRTDADILTIHNVKKPKQKLAVARALITYENIKIKSDYSLTSQDFNQLAGFELRDYVLKHDAEIQKQFEKIQNTVLCNACGSPSALVATMLLIKRESASEAFETFESQIITGNAPKDSPVQLLRELLLKEKLNKQIDVTRKGQTRLMAMVIKSFNAHSLEKTGTSRLVNWNYELENFPSIITRR